MTFNPGVRRRRLRTGDLLIALALVCAMSAVARRTV